MGIWDTLTTPKTPTTPTSSGGLWDGIGTQKSTPAPVLSDTFAPTAQSTPQIAKPGTPDIGDYLFNPKAQTKIQPLGFTPEQAPTFTGPRAIFGPAKIITDFFTGFIKGATQGASDIYKLAAPKNAPANNVTLPKQVAEGFLPEQATDQSGKILSAAQRTQARQKELDADTPATPGLNAAQAIFEVGLPAAFNVLFTEDIAKNVTQDFLKKTGFQSALGLKYSKLADLPTEDFVKTVSDRTRETVVGIADDLKAGKITQVDAQKKMADIGNEYKNLGDLYSRQDNPRLNKMGQLFENTSIALNEDIKNLGRDYSPIWGKVRPAADTLPGYRTTPGQAPAMGLSTEEIQPVGFHDYQEPSVDIGENGTNTVKKSIWDGIKTPKDTVVGTAKVGETEIPIKKGGEVAIPEVKNRSLFDEPPTPKAPAYEGEKDLSIKTLEKLKGRSTVSKKFVENLTNQPDLKQQERDVVRAALKDYPDGSQIPVAEFAKKVKADLLPLKVNDDLGGPMGGYRYESVTLSEKTRGNVENYMEKVYESPIKTSAGDVHFSGNTKKYFGHTRVEDMANNSTRRIIEVQSDLYQKGNLERELPDRYAPGQHLTSQEENRRTMLYSKADNLGLSPEEKNELKTLDEKRQSNFENRKTEVSKLSQYNDPTAHFRMVREEIKKAAQDGKTKLQFPTGETAMKIEGLGQNNNFQLYDEYGENKPLDEEDLKIGREIKQGATHWIITDVLGDGKFKAVPKNKTFAKTDYLSKDLGYKELPDGNVYKNSETESFDISGKVDTNNPIYKFYEKDLGRYLKNKYGAVPVTDAQGVSWYEVPISKDIGEKPVEAFSKGKVLFGKSLGMSVDQIKELIYKDIPKDQVRLYFRDDLIDGVANGKYTSTGFEGIKSVMKPMIEIYAKGGVASPFTAFHEAYHYLLDNVATASERSAAIQQALKDMGPLEDTSLKIKGYKGTPEQRAEEFLANKHARERVKMLEAEAKGEKYEYDPKYKTLFQKIDSFIKNIIETYKRVVAHIKQLLKESGQGGYVKNPLAEEPEIPTEKNLPEETKKSEPPKRYSAEGIPLSARSLEAKSTRMPSSLSPELEKRRVELENKKQMLNESPFSKMNTRILKDNEGQILELGDVSNPAISRKMEDMMMEAGYQDPRDFAEAYEKYLGQKDEVQKLQRQFIDDRREFSSNVRDEKNFFADERRAKTEAAARAGMEKAREIQMLEAKKRRAIEQANRYSSPGADNLYKSIKHIFSPLSAVDARTKEILRNWNYKRVAGQELANIEAHKLSAYKDQGMGIIHQFESGEHMPERGKIQRVFNDLWVDANERGGGVGIHSEYLPRYVPHVYKGGRAEQRLAILDYLVKEKGMSVEEAKDYMDEVKQLSQDQSRRLKLTPAFTKERIFPTYAAAMKYGLKPRYTNIADLAGYYRQEMEKTIANRELISDLEDEAKILPDVSSPKGWSKLNNQFSGQTTYEAPPALARVINNIFRDEEMLGPTPKILRAVANVSKFAQEMALSAGFPKSSVNFYTIGQTVKELTAGNVKAIPALIRSNFNGPTERYFLEHKDDLIAMAKHGIKISSRIGKFGESTFGEMVKDKNIKGAVGVGFDKLFNEKTFDSFMPMLEVQLFSDVKQNAIEKGMSPADAEMLAADTVKNNFGMNTDDFARGQTTNDALSALLFAPKFRESVLGSLFNTGKAGYDLVKYLATGGKSALNPALGRNRRLLFGMILAFAAYNLLNKKLNGGYMWDNPSGHEFDLRIPFGDKGDVVYTQFMPSYLSTARNLASGVIATGRGDLKTAGQKFGSLFSMPVRTITEVLTNSDYFGRQIYDDKDSVAKKSAEIASYVGLQVNHPYIKEIVNQVEKKNPLYQSIVYALEFPLKFTTQKKEDTNAYYDMLDSKDVKNSQKKQDFLPVYTAIQDLIANGQKEEADARVNELADEDYALYKKMYSADKTKKTNAMKVQIYPTYTKVQKLISKGDTAKADEIINNMTDDEYHAYELLYKADH